MKNKIIANFEKKFFGGNKSKHPEFRPGDTLRIDYRIQEAGAKDRVQAFEGVCIRVKRGTADASFTVRKLGANNVGVERIFPLHSPNLEKITVKSRGIVRRSRLYYLRNLAGKAARIRSRFDALALKEVESANEAASTEKK